ncbi:four helix bundle protein [Flavobacterium sp. RHBU_3]|uniref:four helix bundle protein n=1 Tax=Flavobacterium sp. RHBU_3 TaxID=3391184 RepID=UPI0039850350
MYTFSFEKLEVWIDAKEFTKMIYFYTNNFPDSEKFALSSQLRRASVSVCSNLAEGTSRATYKDKAHFTTMAFSSAVEVLNQLIISYELGFLNEQAYQDLKFKLESITNKLNALKKYQLGQTNK